MKNRFKILVMTGVLSLSAIGAVQFTYAEESEIKVTSESGAATEVTEAPVTEAPVTEAPVTEAPATEAPATEPPATEAPSTEPPVTEVPETETQTTEMPATEMPGSETETVQTESESASETEKETKATEAKDKTKETEKIDEEAAKRYEETTGESIYVFGSYPVGDITENTNEIYDYLRNVLGLNHAAACGVLANIQCESNFASTAVGDGGTSYGLCQWHLGRFSALINWCNANGYEYHSIQGQLGYLTCELQVGYASVYQYLLSVPDTAQGAYDAAYYWCKYFEIPSNLEYNSQMRADLAMNLYYPKTLGTQGTEETETEERTLDKDQMEQAVVSAPQSISRMSRLDVSKEDTVDQVLMSADKGTDSQEANMRQLKKDAEAAVEQALKEYSEKSARVDTTQDNEEKLPIISSEELAIFENTIAAK